MDDDITHGSVPASAISVLIDLKDRAKALMAELEAFRQHLRLIRQEGFVEVASFRATVQSELTMLERLAEQPENEKTIHVARSSNLPFLEMVWSTAKKSKYQNLVALQKRVYYNSPNKSKGSAMFRASRVLNSTKVAKNAAVTVDAITNHGTVWVKLSLVTNTRLLFDLAKQGWNSGGSDSEDGHATLAESDDESDIPLVKSAREVCRAARSFRARTKIPVVHLVLPRILRGVSDEVDSILGQCRTAGAVVFCGEAVEPGPASLQEGLNSMAPHPLSQFSSVLNVDCTILLALVSEFSHAKVSKESWFHKALQRQVEIEGNENLLHSLLYPAMGSHSLVCTKEAAKRMREIVDTIGIPSEQARTRILLGDDRSRSRTDLIEDMQQESAYDVPEDWQLPIKIVDQFEDEAQAHLPKEAKAVCKDMTDINKSVFLYGWGSKRTTITSNRTIVKQIENDLEKLRDIDESVWPSIWLCLTARSLVGKEKRGEKKRDPGNHVTTLPDPLRREQQRRNGLDVLSSREGREVQDLRPEGYPCKEVLAAKNAARRAFENGEH